MPRKEHHGRRDVVDDRAIDAALAGVVPDARERAFVLRCILDEGPRHHRIASFTLLRMLAAVLEELGAVATPAKDGSTSPVGMRIPPNVASASDDAEFPIGVPTRMIRQLMSANEAEQAIASLSDGPAHHALANAAMASLLEAIYEHVRKERAAKHSAEPR